MSFGQHNADIVISTPLRTAIGTFGGSLKDVPATELGATVGKAVIERSGVDPARVDQVIVGNILSAGQGMNPGRQVGVKSGVPVEAPGLTLNRMCGSGLQAVINAAQEIALGDAEVVLAGGIENMDQAPFLMPKGRYGYRMGMPDAKIIDHMVYDGLWDVFNDYHMGTTAENVAERYGISREDCDAYAARSHQLAAKANSEESFAGQIVPVQIKQRKQVVDFTTDEHVRPEATAEGLANLRPVFKKDGLVTAGNASGVNDGAALMLVSSAAAAEQLGLPIQGRLVSASVSGVDPAYMGIGMIPASAPGTGEGRPDDRRHRHRGGQRGVRLGGPGRAAGARRAGREDEPGRRGGGARPSDRRDGRGADREGPPRAGTPAGSLRARHPVHRRRDGNRGGARTAYLTSRQHMTSRLGGIRWVCRHPRTSPAPRSSPAPTPG